jgi:hemerythrin-like domain-containing protein
MTARVSPEAGGVEFFTADHRACDQLWVAVEDAAEAGDASAAQAAFAAFDAATRRHFDIEELVLFPALEEATGVTMGPTRVMRMEHEQMRGLLSRMATAASSSDLDALVEHGDTLLMLTQQHNLKEEGMLYPMAASQLQAQWPDIASKVGRYLAR